MKPGRQLGLLWGSVAVALIAASPWAVRLGGVLPACPVKRLAELPCPGCGSFRAARALAGLDVAGALAVNPLATLGWIALIGGGLLAGAWALSGREVPTGPRALPMWLRVGIGLVVALNWTYLVWAGV